MNEEEKKEYLEQYQQTKKKGVPFYPDILFKDAVVSLIVFLLLVLLAYFVGAPLEERADPADTSYTPRPEWYFLFLFQLLKYFPGNLEFLGVVVIPTLAIILLLLLPALDRGPKRHYRNRLIIIGITALMLVGVVFLTVQSYIEIPPPAEIIEGDQTAALYAQNCAGCHGPSINVEPDINLHAVIAQGQHEGMPEWSADLTTDQIDALAGFILSPKGSELFTQYCSSCHEAPELVAGDPLELKSALEQEGDYPPHADLEIPRWSEVLDPEDQTALVNFLVAPDGQRLYAINCAPCHGSSVAVTGSEEELSAIISKGGLHLEMPPWEEKLNDFEIGILAEYVVDPGSVPDGEDLFAQNCSTCHGERIPAMEEVETARQVIASGGSHETMPIWEDVLTEEQLSALVSYTFGASEGTSTEAGQELFAANCALCHGEYGEGGHNPARSGDIIAPISTSEYLKTRDDFTLKTIIEQGQPNFGMSPFGSGFGGPLADDDVDAIVAFMRSWEENPPVELPPEIVTENIALDSQQIYTDLCSQCHGEKGEGGVGPALSDPEFQGNYSDEDIFNSISEGHEATPMIAWGEILSSEQITGLVQVIRQMEPLEREPEEVESSSQPAATPSAEAPSFVTDILPIFESKCNVCHGTLGGWDGSSYESVMNSGDHAPVVIPGDPEGSFLVQKLLDTQTIGGIMPPGGKNLPDSEIQLIIDWILAGALEK